MNGVSIYGLLSIGKIVISLSQLAETESGFSWKEASTLVEDISPFCGATDTPVLDFWLRLPWVLKTEWAALFALGRGVRSFDFMDFRQNIVLRPFFNPLIALSLIWLLSPDHNWHIYVL